MNVLFLGYVVPPEEAGSLSGISIAGNNMQWNVIKNLAKYPDINITCLTLTPIATFPRDKKVYQNSDEIDLGENITAKRVKFINLPVIKQFSQIINMCIESKKVVKENPDAIVLGYNMFPQIGIPIKRLKNKYKGINTVCLLADLPIDDNKKRGIGSKLLRFFFDKSTRSNLSICDQYIVLNKYVGETFIEGKEYIVIDGGIDEKNISIGDTLSYDKRRKNIIYSGALTEYSGIMNLIKAMDYVKDTDALLEIYGGGYLKDEIEEIVKEKKNVKYCGKVDNKTMLFVQQRAYLLVNPRPVDDEISQVTFPSKMFEYMSSGTAVLSTELNGLTEDYLKNIYHIKSNEPHLLAEKIDEILRADTKTLQKLALCAREFIFTNKTWKLQSEKIHTFLENN